MLKDNPQTPHCSYKTLNKNLNYGLLLLLHQLCLKHHHEPWNQRTFLNQPEIQQKFSQPPVMAPKTAIFSPDTSDPPKWTKLNKTVM